MARARRLAATPAVALVAAVAVTAALTLALPLCVDYDAWNWLLWGRELVHGHLDTRGGTVWKPLPVVATAPLALTGGAAPWLWLLVERTAALGALVAAWRLGARGGGRGAAILAVVLVAVVGDALRWWYAGTSEWLLVAAVLWAVEARLAGRSRVALACWAAAALLRPEAWPLLGTEVWLQVRARTLALPSAAAVLLAVPIAWIGFEWLGSGTPFAGSRRALTAPGARAARDAAHPWLYALSGLPWSTGVPVLVGAALAPLLTWRTRARRDAVLLPLAVAAGWAAIVAAMAQLGYPGLPRFLAPAAALAAVVAAVGAAMLCGRRSRVAVAAGAAVVGVGLAVTLAAAEQRVAHDAAALRHGIVAQRGLDLVIRRAGGPTALTRCGRLRTNPFAVPAVAWALRDAGAARRRRGLVVLQTRSRAGLPLRPLPGTTRVRDVASAPDWRVLERCPRRHAPAHLA